MMSNHTMPPGFDYVLACIGCHGPQRKREVGFWASTPFLWHVTLWRLRREVSMGLTTRQGAVLALVTVLGLATASATFFEDFTSGWDKRWVYSADEKYTGRFAVDTPEGWTKPGLKV